MRKLYCDRCGKEVDWLDNICVPGDVPSRSKIIEVCEECGQFIEESIKGFNDSIIKVRMAFYETLIPNVYKEVKDERSN